MDGKKESEEEQSKSYKQKEESRLVRAEPAVAESRSLVFIGRKYTFCVADSRWGCLVLGFPRSELSNCRFLSGKMARKYRYPQDGDRSALLEDWPRI